MRNVVIAIASICLISGCAALGQNGDRGQRTAVGGALGAAAGCGVALALGKDCLTWGAVGGIAGATIGWVYESEKVATGESVNAKARQAGVSVPEDKVVLQSYDIKSGTSIVKQGGTVISNGTIKLIGRSSTPPNVEEKLILVAPDGREGAPQIGKIAAVDGAGEYKSSGNFIIPPGFPQGRYIVKGVLSLDGKVAATKRFTFQVAYIHGKQVFHLTSVE
jgi:hypothetical protein